MERGKVSQEGEVEGSLPPVLGCGQGCVGAGRRVAGIDVGAPDGVDACVGAQTIVGSSSLSLGGRWPVRTPRSRWRPAGCSWWRWYLPAKNKGGENKSEAQQKLMESCGHTCS